MPLPLPLLPPLIVIHEALLAAVQPQPVPAETPTLPVVLDCEIERLVGEIVGAQPSEYPNVFEAVLALAPPGPIAVTRPSYVTPGVGVTVRRAMKSTRITPLEFGLGLPRSTVANAVVEPWG